MTTPIHLQIQFWEPYRVAPWHGKGKKNRRRGHADARWQGARKKGRPCITGTLLRSAVLTAAETLIWLHGGQFAGTACCRGAFRNSGARVFRGGTIPRLRKRPTRQWARDGRVCPADAPFPCPLCLLLGRCDAADSDHVRESDFDVRFSNFHPPGNAKRPLDQWTRSRMRNRIDPFTGAASDHFSVREADLRFGDRFAGAIHLSDRSAASSGLRPLLRDALELVDVLAGARCRITITRDPASIRGETAEHSPTEPPSPFIELETAATTLQKSLPASVPPETRRRIADRLRTRPDAFRESKPPSSSPGTPHSPGGDLPRIHKSPFRVWLARSFGRVRAIRPDFPWGEFCRFLGRRLRETASAAPPPPLPIWGDAERVRVTAGPADPPPRIPAEERPHLFQWRITGRLIAETPFFFGLRNDGTGAARRLLTTPAGNLRIPRTAARGALRRDLNEHLRAGCRAEPGGEFPCPCPVCQLLRTVRVGEMTAERPVPIPVDCRTRHRTADGTAEPGWRLERETGPAGTVFRFSLGCRGPWEEFPRELTTVLDWWRQGCAFLGAHTGIGRGRFRLEDPRMRRWDLKNQWDDFVRYREAGEPDTWGGEGPFSPSEPLPPPPWIPDEIVIELPGPFRSPSLAGPDSTGHPAPRRAGLPAASFRGVLRAAVARRFPGAGPDHERCDCILCRLFGSDHDAGKLRVEDLIPLGTVREQRFGRGSVDRFLGAAAGRNRFSFPAVAGGPAHPVALSGTIWKRADLTGEEEAALAGALADIRAGRHFLGGGNGIGFGWPRFSPSEGISVEPPAILRLRDRPPSISPEDGSTYWPHYFLPPPDAPVQRERRPPGHGPSDGTTLSGRLVCALRTETPLIVPEPADADSGSPESEGRRIPFFTLADQPAIPGSALRGMASAVYEALTHSCLRVLDEKRRLSWRMTADEVDQWKPGRVVADKDGLAVAEMEAHRIPVYDNPELVASGDGRPMPNFRPGGDQWAGDAGPLTLTDVLLLSTAEKNRSFLENHPRVAAGRQKSTWYPYRPHPFDSLAAPRKKNFPFVDEGPKKREGYVHATGPNRLAVRRGSEPNADGDGWPAAGEPIRHNIVSREMDRPPDAETPRPRPLPRFEAEKNGRRYVMTKRCERLFVPQPENGDKLPIPTTVAEKFHQLCRAYARNARNIPPPFRTWLPEGGRLREGVLGYFRRDAQGRVAEIIPVAISRHVDDEVLAEKLRDDLRPCVREIVDPEWEKTVAGRPWTWLYHHHPEGLCPACALFGTRHYRGRVAFGFGFPVSAEVRMAETGRPIPLPRAGRPRPTWSMPDSGARIPGRKWYVHHHGWRRVLEASRRNPPEEAEPAGPAFQAVDSGQEFRFEVRFHNLREWELGLLMFALSLEPGMAHKLGRGKAMGFGSVSVRVDRLDVRGEGRREPSVEMARVRGAAMAKLRELWGARDRSGVVSKLENLFRLLTLPDGDPEVRYPSVRAADDPDGRPGYRELGETDFPAVARGERLAEAWRPWRKK